MNLNCFCKLKNGNLYILNKNILHTKYKEKATDEFVLVHEIVNDYYECPLDQILTEIEEAFDYRFLVYCNNYGTGDSESGCALYDEGVIFRDTSFHNHPGWELEDRDTIMKKVPFSEIKEFIVYKDTFIKNGVVFEEEQVERIVLSKDEWLDLRQKFDRSKI